MQREVSEVEFYYGGYDRVHKRRVFRNYLIVRTGSRSETVLKMLAKNSLQRPRLQASNGYAHQVLRRLLFPHDGSLIVYEYFTPARHNIRKAVRHFLCEEITELLGSSVGTKKKGR